MRADLINQDAPMCVTYPAIDAMAGAMDAAASVAIAAACTTAISGMAAKFRTSPAKVTRENTRALTGMRAISAVTVATRSDAIAIAAVPPKLLRSHLKVPTSQATSRAAPSRMPSVAPNDRTNPASSTATGESATRATAAHGQRIEGGPAMIEDSTRQVDTRARHRPHHRGARSGQLSVETSAAIVTAAAILAGTRATRSAPSRMVVRIAMFPPEIAITWYVPASCRRL